MRFDPVILSPARMAIIISILKQDPLSFSDLKEQTGLADGNLHVQCRKLISAGYISGTRIEGNGRPHTLYSLTDSGRNAILLHYKKLKELVESKSQTVQARIRRGRSDDSQVWST